jgi:hypothetical protein
VVVFDGIPLVYGALTPASAADHAVSDTSASA